MHKACKTPPCSGARARTLCSVPQRRQRQATPTILLRRLAKISPSCWSRARVRLLLWDPTFHLGKRSTRRSAWPQSMPLVRATVARRDWPAPSAEESDCRPNGPTAGRRKSISNRLWSGSSTSVAKAIRVDQGSDSTYGRIQRGVTHVRPLPQLASHSRRRRGGRARPHWAIAERCPSALRAIAKRPCRRYAIPADGAEACAAKDAAPTRRPASASHCTRYKPPTPPDQGLGRCRRPLAACAGDCRSSSGATAMAGHGAGARARRGYGWTR